MNLPILASSVGIGAVIGYVTNYVAIKLLFRPYKPIKIGSFSVFPQGVIPREKKALAKKVGEVVRDYILSEEEIKKVVSQKEVKKEVEGFIDSKIESLFDKEITQFADKEEIVEKITSFIEKFVAKNFPMFSGMLSANMIKSFLENAQFDIKINEIVNPNKTKEVIKTEILTLLEDEIPKIFIKADIDKIVEEKVASFDEKRLEDMLFSLMQKHFGFINLAGGVLGGIIGLIQFFIFFR